MNWNAVVLCVMFISFSACTAVSEYARYTTQHERLCK